jgi:hypothetical protein
MALKKQLFSSSLKVSKQVKPKPLDFKDYRLFINSLLREIIPCYTFDSRGICKNPPLNCTAAPVTNRSKTVGV